MVQHENKERELLQELKKMKGVEERKPTPPTGDRYVESRGIRGIRYDMKYDGANDSTGEVMILVSGTVLEDPPLAEKTTHIHGQLPSIVTGLHHEAAADLMAAASVRLQSSISDVVSLCLDVPGKQRSKQYHLETIESFFRGCEQPVGMLHPMSYWIQ